MLFFVCLPARAHARSPRPNVLLIVTDDQRAQGTLEVMPETRSWFMRAGTHYTSAWATTPLCCPSRASILSGLYAHNHGVLLNGGGELVDETRTIERYLQPAGYETGIVGRYLNNWPLTRDPRFFDDFEITTGGYHRTRWNLNGRLATVPEYSTTYTGERGVRFIRHQEREDGRPWFLYVAPSAPHATIRRGHIEFEPQPRYAFRPVGRLPGDPARAETDLSDKPPFLRELVRRAQSLPPGELPGPGRTRAGQLRLLMSVDDMIAGLRDALRHTGELRDTLAIFVSDNGLIWGEHGGVPIKDLPYPAVARIPLLVSWPGHVTAGLEDSRLVANIDLAPTILDAAGRDAVARRLDGNSLLRARWERNRLLLEYFGLGNAIPAWAGLISPVGQYTEYRDPAAGGLFRELYDFRTDPWELANPFGDEDPANDPDVSALSTLLHQDMACRGSSCP